MKKIILLVLSLILALSLASCGAGGNNGEGSGETPKESKYFFNVAAKNGFSVKLDMNMASVLLALGEPLSYFEAASCAFDGLDKTYTYAGFQVLTCPDGNKDFVNSVVITDDSVTTAEGAYIGMSKDEIITKYGSPSEQTSTLLSYVDGNTALNFILKNDAVISIEYIPS